MKQKRITTAATILILTLLLITSCTSKNVPKDIVGKEGIYTELKLTQTKIMEPAEGQTRKIPALLKLENRGKTDTTPTISIKTEYPLKPQPSITPKEKLKGKTLYSQYPDVYSQAITFETGPLPTQTEIMDARITIYTCYDYQTKADFTVCLDSDILEQQKNKPCKPKTVTSSSGQGAPITITSITPKMYPTESGVKPLFEIELENAGKGILIKKGKAKDYCEGKEINQQDIGKIDVKFYLGAEATEIECRQTGPSQMMCDYPDDLPGITGTYSTPVQITMDYGYIQEKQTKLTITR